MGDIILTEPVCRNLKSNFPDCRLTYFTRDQYSDVVEMFSSLDEIRSLQIPGPHEKASDLRAAIKSIDQKFDLVLDIHANLRSRIIYKTLDAEKKMRYKKHRIFRQISVWTKNKQARYNTIQNYLEPLEKLNLAIEYTVPNLNPGEKAEKKAQTFLQEIDFAKDQFAVFAIGASHPAKHYPIKLWAELAELVSARHNLKILVAEKEHFGYFNLFDKLKSEGKLSFAIGQNIKTLAAIIGKAKYTVSNDSGVMHLSRAMNCPTAGLFGPTHPVLGFEPAGEKAIAITTNERCAPCSLHGEKPCYRDRQYCFLNMTPELILDEIDKKLM